jgi:Kunitz/Bovine pancreatic trypsin inhibitor domain
MSSACSVEDFPPQTIPLFLPPSSLGYRREPLLPATTSPGEPLLPASHFSRQFGKFGKLFSCAGCCGNLNRFASQEECVKFAKLFSCAGCRGNLNRFASLEECLKFGKLFSCAGCRGNLNRFASLEECVNTCGGQDPDEETDCSAITCDTR